MLEAGRIRRCYVYPDESVHRFIRGLRGIAQLTGSLPPLAGIVKRDPNDDMIVASPLLQGRITLLPVMMTGHPDIPMKPSP